MKKLKIVYLAHLQNEYRENDEDVFQALKDLGHEVIGIDDRDFDVDNLIKECLVADLFLFHKGGVQDHASENTETNMIIFQSTLQKLKDILMRIPPTCKKVMWYVDKVYGGREIMVESLIPMVDAAFLTDGTFLRRRRIPNAFSLKQGTVEDRVGKPNPIYKCGIAYIGATYGARQEFVKKLNDNFGDNFRVYTNIRNDDFNDLCVSAKIVVSPHYPLNDFYWGDRIYRVLSAGGFIMHPKCYGLQEEEGLISGVHYMGYTNYHDLIEKLHMFLDDYNANERNEIATRGHDYAVKNLNYKIKCQKILDRLCL